MKGASRFTIMILAMLSFGIMALPCQAAAARSFSISVDAYPISFAFSDSSLERVYVERVVTHHHHRDYRPVHYSGRHRQVYHGRGYDRRPYHHHGRYQDQVRWYHR